MKKNLLTVLALLAFTITGFAQGINFEHGDWASVKAKAKKENKIIFIDFYTSWCGPCKMLSKNVFPQKSVGDFYNKHFINYKLDAEKGEGPALAKKYGIKAYPTLIFANANGDFLHQGVGGMQAEALIELGKTALDPNKQLGKLLKGSDTEIKDMPAHLRKLSQERLPYNDKYEAYIKSLKKKELFSKETYDLMVELGGYAAEGFTFDMILKNREAFAKAVGQKEINYYFYRKFLSKSYSAKRKEGSIQSVLAEVNELGFDFAAKIKDKTELSAAMYEGRGYDEFVKNGKLFITKHIFDNDPKEIYGAVFMEAVKFFNRSANVKAYALELADQLIKADYNVAKVNAYLGKQYADAGDLKTALTYYPKASDYNQKMGVEDQSGQSVGFLKKRIATLEKGDYTLSISGLDQYNGLSFKLFYASADEIGEYVETEEVEIKDGKCTVKGNVKVPMVAGWGVYDGDYMKTKGDIILEPGKYKAKVTGRNLEVENGWYNYYAHKGLIDNPKYKEALKNMEEFNKKEGDMKDPAYRKEFFKHNGAINDSKKEYYAGVYNYNADPTARVLAFYIGNLWWDENAEVEMKKLRADLGDHYLLKTIAHYKAESKRSKEMKETVAVGKQIKPFVAKDLNGKEFKLEKVLKKNKYVLVEFWASWCGPCRGLIPHLKKTYKQFHKKGFEIVSFSLDHKENMWKKASEQEDIPWINTSDLAGRKSPIAEMYGVTGIPDSFLVDSNGKIIGTNYRGDDLDKELEKLLK